MSNREQFLSGVVGGVVGFFASGMNPAGAWMGFQYSMTAAAHIEPPHNRSDARTENDDVTPHRPNFCG